MVQAGVSGMARRAGTQVQAEAAVHKWQAAGIMNPYGRRHLQASRQCIQEAAGMAGKNPWCR